MKRKFSRKDFEADMEKISFKETGKEREKEYANLVPFFKSVEFKEFIKAVKINWKEERGKEEKELAKIIIAWADKKGLNKALDADELMGFYIWYSNANDKYDLDPRDIYYEFHNYIESNYKIGDAIKKREDISHRIEMFAHHYKVAAGLADFKSGADWLRENKGKGRAAQVYPTTVKGHPKYDGPHGIELPKILELLKDFPAAYKLAEK